MTDTLDTLASDPVIVEMAQDLVDAEFPPAPEGAEDEADYVFSAAMEYASRGGDASELDFDAPAKAIRLAYEELGGVPRIDEEI